jgi:hypothetical protein
MGIGIRGCGSVWLAAARRWGASAGDARERWGLAGSGAVVGWDLAAAAAVAA